MENPKRGYPRGKPRVKSLALSLPVQEFVGHSKHLKRISKNLSVHHDYVQIRVVNQVLRHGSDQGFFPPLFRVVRHDEHLRVHLRCAALDHVRDWFPIRFQNRVQFDWLGKRGHVNPTVRQLACE